VDWEHILFFWGDERCVPPANVLFLVSGAEKAERLVQVLHDPFQPDLLPAQAVKPVNGAVRWLVDQAAAAKLPP
jgi:6-phosphogluconolactonase